LGLKATLQFNYYCTADFESLGDYFFSRAKARDKKERKRERENKSAGVYISKPPGPK
jgi:hypothetical protein